MPAFYLTLLAVLLAGFGARDQLTIAGLTQRQGRRPALLILACTSACATAVFAAWLAMTISPILPLPARAIFAALTVGFAGAESFLLTNSRPPREPTESLGAAAMVLLAHQLTDAPRFLVFGLAVGMAAPVASGAAGVLGGVVLVAFSWSFPEFLKQPLARRMRRVIGLLLLLTAVSVILSEIGIL